MRYLMLCSHYGSYILRFESPFLRLVIYYLHD